jgi:hypothetical protein
MKYILDKHRHVERLDFTPVLELFDDATISPERLRQLCGTLDITFTGYQDEERLPFLIPEVRAFSRVVRKEWPCAPYFCSLDNCFILIEIMSSFDHLAVMENGQSDELCFRFDPGQLRRYVRQAHRTIEFLGEHAGMSATEIHRRQSRFDHYIFLRLRPYHEAGSA